MDKVDLYDWQLKMILAMRILKVISMNGRDTY